MRASDLLSSRVVDAEGRDLGAVRDVRVRRREGRLELAGIVVGDGRMAALAHALGFAEGRVQGPWPLMALCAQARERARVAAAEDVEDWGPGTVRLSVRADDLEPLAERTE